MRNKSFTIVELVVIIVILSILVAIAIPRINLKRDAQRAACYGSVETIRVALGNYYSKRAMAGTASFPLTISSPTFLPYLNENKLPRHPIGRDWNNYYTTQDSATQYTIATGKASSNGACTGF